MVIDCADAQEELMLILIALTLAALGGYSIFALIAIARTEPPEW